ncbi:MAG: PilZ domain-containing protein [Candidatus Omnitrophica bacterium]|nr:PilZ domain-containing protein [Candidatus Omnitrophota bacterium]
MTAKTTAQKKDERREHPRLEHNLPVKIIANGYDFSTVTKNVSCVGAYCHIPKYVPPFTRVAIKLNLPIVMKAEKKECPVECKGVIVRTEDEKTGGFNIAVFFNDIKDTQKKTISKYISQFIPH